MISCRACLALSLTILLFSYPYLPGQNNDTKGVLPVGADGKPLNLDFETGTLKDWTATGTAFQGQPIAGDTVKPRRGDMQSRHQGRFWIGTYERKGDAPRGTLTSVPFKVTHPWASFLVGGGPHDKTCVELVVNENGKVIHRASGLEEEDMKREVVDLQVYKGKDLFIRLVDQHSGHWGHVNFDDFRFHASRPAFAARPRPAQPDKLLYAGLDPKKSAEVMTVPEDFRVTLFAGEPDIRQPIALCLDDRGRLWVAEAYSYPVRRADKEARDRILIFEDTDGDGKFDKRTVFLENLNLVSGLEIGFGGVWIGAAPYLLYVPIEPGTDKPAGKPQILLDGWGYQDTHETLNTFIWGPDGWLYGCHGVFTHSRVGKPGTPNDQRVPINAGIWRYHPTRHVFEVFAHGTSNPWGLDFNDQGEAFVEACVIPHLYHIIQGGRYLRQAGVHFNPHTYADINTIADHLHYVGNNPHGGNNRSDSAGGGHAHCGTMIYLGGSWPREYRNAMFMGNIHGRRLNVDLLKPKGSGYVATHALDFLLANDASARFINLRYGPDGNVFLIDWYDKQACHHNDPKIWDRDSGRIYKISYRGSKPTPVDLTSKTSQELVELQLHANDWFVRHARRILQERGSDKAVHAAAEKIAVHHAEETRRLRALWVLHATGGMTSERIQLGLQDRSPHVRGWTIQLALERGAIEPELLKRLEQLARTDSSPVVRRFLASGAQRLPVEHRWGLLEGLVSHAEDNEDHNLPLLYWYAAEPLAEADPARALQLAATSRVSTLLPFMIRRLSAQGSAKVVAILVEALGKTNKTNEELIYLKAIQEGLKGQRSVPMPDAWAGVSKRLLESSDAEVRNRAMALGLVFGDRSAMKALRGVLVESKTPLPLRKQALTSLAEARDSDLPPLLHALINDADLRLEAIRALAAFDHPRTPAVLLENYAKLDSNARRAVINTLAARSTYASALLSAVGKKQVTASDVSADVVRQMRNLGDSQIDKQIADVWGLVRSTPAERQALIRETRSRLLRSLASPADLSLGRAVYNKTCAQCHILFGTGGKVGPDITGANRGSLEYLLENILDPSAVIPKEYAMTVLTLESGRVITGIVREETAQSLTVLTQNETLTIPVKDIEARQASNQSLMPDDLLKNLSQREVHALVAYLQSPVQVPVLATADNAADLFNGKDLTGWVGNMDLWSVESGEIVGRTKGLERNEFLRSTMLAADFKFSFQVKLTPNSENSGVQFRSEELPRGDVKGPQADIGAGWWGKLYEEHGRELLWKESGEKYVKAGEWNDYVIEAVGSRVRTWINGKLCVDLDDPMLSRRGIFAFQLHSGGPMEVRFKNLKLVVPSAGK